MLAPKRFGVPFHRPLAQGRRFVLVEVTVARRFRHQLVPALTRTQLVKPREQSFGVLSDVSCGRRSGLQPETLFDQRVKFAQMRRTLPLPLAAHGLDVHHFGSAHNISGLLGC